MDWLSSAYHALGDYHTALAVARAGLHDVPGYLHLENDEAWALAALGDTAATDSLARGWLARAPGTTPFPASRSSASRWSFGPTAGPSRPGG